MIMQDFTFATSVDKTGRTKEVLFINGFAITVDIESSNPLDILRAVQQRALTT